MNINTDTLVLGVIGNPIRHSLSPQLHNAVFSKLGLNAVYLPFAIEDVQLEKALTGMQNLGFRGINVTIPHKEKVIPYMDELSAEARECGAVNVIHFHKGKMIGHNTDGQGFVRSMQEAGVQIQGKALILGAGGAARSIVAALSRAGMNQIELYDIDARRAADLASLASDGTARITGQLLDETAFLSSARTASILINCSPIGMHPNVESSPVSSLEGVGDDTVVADIIYNPEMTLFLQMAVREGCKTINGLPMFVHQAALTQEILLGIEPPVEYMKEVVGHCLKE